MLKKILLALLLVLVAIQFIRPAKNLAAEPSPSDIAAAHSAPPEVRRILENACYDCHSNTTRYPWYADVQPIGWWLADHVKDGKRHLNFSEFAAYTPNRSRDKLEEAIEEIHEGEMPLKSYTLIHASARLTDAERTALVNWFQSVRATFPAEKAEK